MTLPELEKLSDAEISARVATEVMGWTLVASGDEYGHHFWRFEDEERMPRMVRPPERYESGFRWHPSDSVDQAMSLVAKWEGDVTIFRRGDGWNCWLDDGFPRQDPRYTADSLPRAICLAALLAVQSPNHGFRNLREGVAK